MIFNVLLVFTLL